MIKKPITVARNDYMQGIVDLTNKSGLPAFVMVDVLEQTVRELRPMIDVELKKAEATWRAATLKEIEEQVEQTDNNEKE